MEPWALKLNAGDSQGAWDLFVERYRRLIFAAIRHYTTDHDEVMDVFAHVCEALRADDMARARHWLAQPTHTARFSTWLVTVVRNLTVDWFRRRDGRKRLSAIAAELPPLERAIFEYVFDQGRSHVEAYELLRSDHPALSFGAYLEALRATYRSVAARRKRGFMAELAGSEPPEPDAVPEDPVVRAEQGAALADALSTLAPDDRLAVQLFVIDELAADQVARVVGLANAKAVYNRVYRALAELRTRLERAGITGVDL